MWICGCALEFTPQIHFPLQSFSTEMRTLFCDMVHSTENIRNPFYGHTRHRLDVISFVLTLHSCVLFFVTQQTKLSICRKSGSCQSGRAARQKALRRATKRCVLCAESREHKNRHKHIQTNIDACPAIFDICPPLPRTRASGLVDIDRVFGCSTDVKEFFAVKVVGCGVCVCL